jgi:bifunctional non-homologous end joining protein LigD
MPLSEYYKKRSFAKTPEPKGKLRKSGKKLEFVIQKHHATQLHYDFRLELDGVLKSWAVPKGPSLDPKVKRLAMMVEDHPYEYRKFEGQIPEGNYGAGNVIIWDCGWYELDRQAEDWPETLQEGLKRGELKFILHGQKLKGSFALIKTPHFGKNSWLLIKHRDKYASEKDITKQDKSVVSGQLLDTKEAAVKRPKK